MIFRRMFRSVEDVTATFVLNTGICFISFFALLIVRFLGDDVVPTTKPKASAPYRIAASKSLRRVIPHIFTRIFITLGRTRELYFLDFQKA